jgi:hypothetical protein
MRERIAESRYTFSINLPTSLYQKVLNKAGKGRISTFIKEMLEEKLITEEQNQKEKLKQQLISDYQSVAKSKKIQKEMGVWDETISDM